MTKFVFQRFSFKENKKVRKEVKCNLKFYGNEKCKSPSYHLGDHFDRQDCTYYSLGAMSSLQTKLFQSTGTTFDIFSLNKSVTITNIRLLVLSFVALSLDSAPGIRNMGNKKRKTKKVFL